MLQTRLPRAFSSLPISKIMSLITTRTQRAHLCAEQKSWAKTPTAAEATAHCLPGVNSASERVCHLISVASKSFVKASRSERLQSFSLPRRASSCLHECEGGKSEKCCWQINCHALWLSLRHSADAFRNEANKRCLRCSCNARAHSGNCCDALPLSSLRLNMMCKQLCWSH
jgi:hypothetical protein